MDNYLKELQIALKAVTERFHTELQGVRSNRPNPQLVEGVRFVAYEQPMSVNQAGSITVRPPREILVTLWDKSLMNVVMKAIQDSVGGLSVSNDGNVIRATLPQLTDERRAEYTKLAKKIAEAARIQIRTHRDDTMKKLRTAEDMKELSEDTVFKGRGEIQKTVDQANEKIESLLAAKLAEIAE